MRIGEFDTHPLADWLPMMADVELAALVEDLKANGQHDEIVLYEKKILDGRNRARACELAGLRPQFRDFHVDEGEPAAFVISMALHRRHWNESQKAIYAALALTKRVGRPSKHRNVAEFTAREAAEKAGVGERTIEEASFVRSKGIAELVAAVENGSIKMHPAAELAKLPQDEQLEALQAKLAEGSKRRIQRDKKPANDETPREPRVELVRVIMRALEHVGATVKLAGETITIAFHGQVFGLELQRRRDQERSA